MSSVRPLSGARQDFSPAVRHDTSAYRTTLSTIAQPLLANHQSPNYRPYSNKYLGINSSRTDRLTTSNKNLVHRLESRPNYTGYGHVCDDVNRTSRVQRDHVTREEPRWVTLVNETTRARPNIYTSMYNENQVADRW